MATENLKILNWGNGGNNYKFTTSGTSYDEVTLPNWAKTITILAKNNSIVVSYVGTNGGTPVHGFPQAADSVVQYNPMQTTASRKIYIASQSSTSEIYIILE